MKLKYNNEGFSLIELIVALAILSIIILVSFNFFIYNNRLFDKGDRLSQVQYDARMTSDLITSELRNINEVSLSDNTLDNSISLSDIQSKYDLISSINFELIEEETRYIIRYNIQASDTNNENDYNLESEVLLNNINSASTGSGTAIYYE